MFENEDMTDIAGYSKQIQLQLLLGIIGIPLLVLSPIIWILAIAPPPTEMYEIVQYLLYNFSSFAWLIGTTFIVVGNIAVLRRNGSMRTWILLVVYILDVVGNYALSYATSAAVITPEDTDMIFIIMIIVALYRCIMILLSLTAWTSIRHVVSNRCSYLAYLALYSLGGIIVYLASGFLFGFGTLTVHNFEEVVLYQIPSIVVSVITNLTLLTFFIGQLGHSREQVGLKE